MVVTNSTLSVAQVGKLRRRSHCKFLAGSDLEPQSLDGFLVSCPLLASDVSLQSLAFCIVGTCSLITLKGAAYFSSFYFLSSQKMEASLPELGAVDLMLKIGAG